IRGDMHLVETPRALATRLGVELMLVDYPTPIKAVEGLKVSACDVAFLGIDPSRAADVGFSPPFVELDFTYLVPAGSSNRRRADADRPGGSHRGHTQSRLDRHLKSHAEGCHIGVRRYSGSYLRSAADRTGRMGISGVCT